MTQKTILIVDDERPIRRLVRLILTKAGYDVIEAEDGAAIGFLCRRILVRRRVPGQERVG